MTTAPGAGAPGGPHGASGALPVVVRAVIGRPWLAPGALAEGLRLAAPRWWRRRPFLPLPDAGLWHFRMETAYGGAGDASPSVDDVRSFLSWCSRMHHWRK